MNLVKICAYKLVHILNRLSEECCNTPIHNTNYFVIRTIFSFIINYIILLLNSQIVVNRQFQSQREIWVRYYNIHTINYYINKKP